MKNAQEVLFNETSLKHISQIRVSFLRFWDKLSFFGTSRAPSPTAAFYFGTSGSRSPRLFLFRNVGASSPTAVFYFGTSGSRSPRLFLFRNVGAPFPTVVICIGTSRQCSLRLFFVSERRGAVPHGSKTTCRNSHCSCLPLWGRGTACGGRGLS